MGHTVLEDCQHPYIMYHNNTHTLKQNVIAFIGKSREIQKNKNPNQNMPGSTLSWQGRILAAPSLRSPQLARVSLCLCLDLPSRNVLTVVARPAQAISTLPMPLVHRRLLLSVSHSRWTLRPTRLFGSIRLQQLASQLLHCVVGYCLCGSLDSQRTWIFGNSTIFQNIWKTWYLSFNSSFMQEVLMFLQLYCLY